MLLGHEKISFLHLPTPIERLDNLSAKLGINLYIKRDDLTPLAAGGNKLRKLEYFLADAKAKGATMLLTVGGAQTNHGRLTCAVARKYGMKAAIVCVDEYPGELSANLLLDGMMGCDVWLRKKDPAGTKPEGALLRETVAEVTKNYEKQGEKVYYIPMGGSNELGILGYYECAAETAGQLAESGIASGSREFPRLITTVGSMGTYMGLFTGIRMENLPLRLTGIGIMPYENGIRTYAKNYFDKVCGFYGFDTTCGRASGVTENDFDITDKYDRGAYNNPCKEVRETMYLAAEKEALILDPCYTGKCFAGMVEMVKKGEIAQDETVIFLHTGGMPGINTPFHRVEIEKERDKFINVLDENGCIVVK